MKKCNLKRILLPSLFTVAFASGAQAHKVLLNADDPSLNFLKDNGEAEVALGVAEYCARQGIPVATCVDRLKTQNTVEEAASCNKRIRGGGLIVDPAVLHKVGGGKGAEGVWHDTFINDKDSGGVHKHEYSHVVRYVSGNKLGGEAVAVLKASWEEISKTGGRGSSWGQGLSGDLKTSALTSIIAEASAGIKIDHSSSASTSSTEQGPPRALIQEVFRAGFKLGYADPRSVDPNTMPDALCYKGNDRCLVNGGGVIDPAKSKGEDSLYSEKPLSFPGTKEEWDKLEGKNPSKVADTPSPSEPATFPTSTSSSSNPQPDSTKFPSTSPTCDKVSAGGVKTPKVIVDDIVLVDVAEGQGTSLLEECVAELQQKKNDLVSSYAEPTEEKQNLKQEAEEALKFGVCMPEWYGDDFCRNFNAQKKIITSNPQDSATPSEPQENPNLTPGWVDVAPLSEEEEAKRQEEERLKKCQDPSLNEAEKRLYR